MKTLHMRQPDEAVADEDRVFPATGLAYRLSSGLALASASAAAFTFLVTGILTGPAAMNGSARGTALVVMLVAVPALLVSMRATSKGNARALIFWLGSAGYLLYNAFLFVFATPFNELFLVYVAMLSLSIWTLIAVLIHTDLVQLGQRFSAAMPVRAIAVYVWVVVTLNLVGWLSAIIPALFDQPPSVFLDGTGRTTNPVYVQDLAFWLLLMTVAAVWLWRRQPWGYLIAGSVLTMWVMESVGVAVDQWFGHAADPTSSVVAAEMVWVFAALAAIGCVPLIFYFRHLRPR